MLGFRRVRVCEHCSSQAHDVIAIALEEEECVTSYPPVVKAESLCVL